ncbi:glyceraldehyde-3-phosphate dehydrogenase, type I [Acinetobacter dispersus]|nr:glyceraldehyde-3-phosphate dehydrogenase, type I [Acinetobacter dispersus]
MARLLLEKHNSNSLNLKAIVVRKRSNNDLHKRASLLRRDSIHGQFKGTISVDEENEAIIANGKFIKIIYETNEELFIDFSRYGVSYATLIDNTGKNRDIDTLSNHLRCKGINRVIVTAPTDSSIKNIVFGVNHNLITRNDKIISAASCTTNAIVPILNAIHNKFGIKAGHIETIHSYTNDQNLLDNYHKKDRRGRSAVTNMVITETGAAEAIKSILPELNGKITGSAIRVPTADVSIAVLSLSLNSISSREEINEYVRLVSNSESLQEQIDFTNSTEVVSSDFIGSQTAGIFDAQATIVSDSQIVLYVWYDNEMGYSSQVLRIASKVAGIHYLNIQ